MGDIGRAVEILRAGGLVAFPTETVYGLGADATDADAVARLYAVKRRPPDHPVIAHIGSRRDLGVWSEPTPAAMALAESLWPGPLTMLVARRAGGIADAVTGGRPSVGLRVPGHPLALELLRAFDGPIAAPSANRFGRVSPTTAAHVRADLADDVDLILDGGPCSIGVESTIVDCTVAPPEIRRAGAITRQMLRAVLGTDLRLDLERAGVSGTLESHYAPNARVVITTRAELSEIAGRLGAGGERIGVLALNIDAPPSTSDLTVEGGVLDYARLLYERLREADRRSLDLVLAVPPAPEGVGAAIVDRLRRSAGAG